MENLNKERYLFDQYEKANTEEEKEAIRIKLGLLPSDEFWEKVSQRMKEIEKEEK